MSLQVQFVADGRDLSTIKACAAQMALEGPNPFTWGGSHQERLVDMLVQEELWDREAARKVVNKLKASERRGYVSERNVRHPASSQIHRCLHCRPFDNQRSNLIQAFRCSMSSDRNKQSLMAITHGFLMHQKLYTGTWEDFCLEPPQSLATRLNQQYVVVLGQTAGIFIATMFMQRLCSLQATDFADPAKFCMWWILLRYIFCSLVRHRGGQSLTGGKATWAYMLLHIYLDADITEPVRWTSYSQRFAAAHAILSPVFNNALTDKRWMAAMPMGCTGNPLELSMSDLLTVLAPTFRLPSASQPSACSTSSALVDMSGNAEASHDFTTTDQRM